MVSNVLIGQDLMISVSYSIRVKILALLCVVVMALFSVLMCRNLPNNSSLGGNNEFEYSYLSRHARKKNQPIGMSWQTVCRRKLFQSNDMIGDKQFVLNSLGPPSIICSGIDLSKALAVAGRRQGIDYFVEKSLWDELVALSDGSMYRNHHSFRHQFLEIDTQLGSAQCFVYFARDHIVGPSSQISQLADHSFIIFFSNENIVAFGGCQELISTDF